MISTLPAAASPQLIASKAHRVTRLSRVIGLAAVELTAHQGHDEPTLEVLAAAVGQLDSAIRVLRDRRGVLQVTCRRPLDWSERAAVIFAWSVLEKTDGDDEAVEFIGKGQAE